MFGEIIGALAGGLLGGGDSESSQTQTREPWGPAQEWLKANIGQGQRLQNQYMSNPFSQQQQDAYSNAFGMSDAYRAMLPQLLQGLNTGTFDRTNPLKRPTGTNYGGFSPSMTNIGAFRTPTITQQAPAPVVAAPTPVFAQPYYPESAHWDRG